MSSVTEERERIEALARKSSAIIGAFELIDIEGAGDPELIRLKKKVAVQSFVAGYIAGCEEVLAVALGED